MIHIFKYRKSTTEMIPEQEVFTERISSGGFKGQWGSIVTEKYQKNDQ